jgi:hypothetical protein
MMQTTQPGWNDHVRCAGFMFVVIGMASTLLANSFRASGEVINAGRDLGSSGNSTS